MTAKRLITRTRLMDLLSEGPAAPDVRAIKVIAAGAPEELPLRAIPAVELRAIYQGRRTRMPDSHPQSDAVNQLLRALEGRDGNVGIVTVELQNDVVVVWLSEQTDHVLATIVGELTR